MKYSLRSLIIAALVLPPLLALAIVSVPRILAWFQPPPPQEKHTIMFIETPFGDVPETGSFDRRTEEPKSAPMKSSIRDLLLATLWAAIAVSSCLAMLRLYPGNGGPWEDPGKQGMQLGMNLFLGVACGGIVGCFMQAHWRGPLIGLAVAVAVDMIWLYYLMRQYSAG